MGKYTPSEQAAHRAELVAALRSGMYKQVQLGLHIEDRFCCLGVACEISGLGHWVQSHMRAGVIDFVENPNTEVSQSHAALTPKVVDYYGFIDDVASLTIVINLEGEDYTSLMGLNDAAGYSFKQIADVLEQGEVAVVGAT